MNAGLGSLTKLKEQLLAGAMRSGTTHDTRILAIGLGAAAAMDKFCNRKLARLAGATYVCRADTDHVNLDRYPVETITKIELKTDQTQGYVTQSGLTVNREDERGYVYLGSIIGLHTDFLRFTFDGGYWFDDTEDDSGTKPVGATALPDDVKLAWYLFCKEIWNQSDPISLGVAATQKSETRTLADLELPASVKQLLSGYTRYAL